MNQEYCSTQVNLSGPVARFLVQAGARIPDADLAEDGRETEPHVTVKYGLHGEDPNAVRALIENEPPVKLKFGKVSVFPDSGLGEVLKVSVVSGDLHRLHWLIGAQIPNTETHPKEYRPHATLAYVQPGKGVKHAGRPVPGVTGHEITLDSIVFSTKAGKHIKIQLKGNRPMPEHLGPRSAPPRGPSTRNEKLAARH
jgi:2'-5' RNA ligase